MKNRKIAMFALAAMALLAAGCSGDRATPAQQEAAQQKPAEKPPEPKAEFETGRAAFHRMYAQARLWAQDAQPVRLDSEPIAVATAGEGKAGLWRGQYASPARRGLRPYIWSGASGEKGVSHGTEDTFNPSNSSTQPFDMQFLRTDTEKAFEIAQGKGGEKLLKQKPETPVFYSLDWDGRKNALHWHVYYGTTPADARLHVIVDASTGEFVRVAK